MKLRFWDRAKTEPVTPPETLPLPEPWDMQTALFEVSSHLHEQIERLSGRVVDLEQRPEPAPAPPGPPQETAEEAQALYPTQEDSRYAGTLSMIAQLSRELEAVTVRIRAIEGKAGLESLFQSRRCQDWSINQHMDTLRNYSAECRHVTELGTNVGFSTIALLAGRPDTLITYDIVRCDGDISLIEEVARDCTETKFSFRQQSTLEVEIEPTDLLFVDTLHTYAQVKEELRLHGNKARKYLIFHDTVGSAYTDEIVSDPPAPIQGIRPAIEEFVAENPHWKLYEEYDHQYGLQVYRRVDE